MQAPELPAGHGFKEARQPADKGVGLVIGMYYLHLFLGNTFVGWLAGFLETMPGREFWGLHALLVASAGVLLLACRVLFGRLLAPEAAAPGPQGA